MNVDELEGKEAKRKVLDQIKSEGISIEKSYDAFLNNNAYFLKFTTNLDPSNDQVTIVIPAFTDYTDMQQTMFLSQQLGYFYFIKNNKRTKRKFLFDTNSLLIQRYVIKKSWQEAKIILKNLGIIEGEDLSSTKSDLIFNQIKDYHIASIIPDNDLFSYMVKKTMKPVLTIIKYWVVSYLVISLLVLITGNGIPIPFISYGDFYKELSTADLTVLKEIEKDSRYLFFEHVNVLFLVALFTRFMVYLGEFNGRRGY